MFNIVASASFSEEGKPFVAVTLFDNGTLDVTESAPGISHIISRHGCDLKTFGYIVDAGIDAFDVLTHYKED